MNRRALLASLGGLGAAGIGGYWYLRRPGYPPLPNDASGLSYTVRRRDEWLLRSDTGESTGLALVTDEDGLSRFRTDWQTPDDRAYFDATDFSTDFLLAVQVITSADSTGVSIGSVGQTPDGTVWSNSTVANPSGNDDASPRGFILRVERTGTQPTGARHVHRGGNTDSEMTAGPASIEAREARRETGRR
ncbi:hypothetical protein [Haloarchaeobius sp. DFWS5]|uniref:hypothetical protein n=1 Tax=Haloarchaeobius sp. DFWS5 TaxID=3446114 RepID=UPI003EBD5684